jgi:hypothetical protein
MNGTPTEGPQNRPPAYVLWSVVVGVGLTAVGLVIGGLTGYCQTEYKVPRTQQAILLALGWSCYGIVPGLIVGLVLRWRSRR